jgi:hypothetical protein
MSVSLASGGLFGDSTDESVASQGSGSGCEDADGDLPDFQFCGPDICRAKFMLVSSGGVQRVCGKKLVLCLHKGHRLNRLSACTGAVGWYRVIRSAANKYRDSVFTT